MGSNVCMMIVWLLPRLILPQSAFAYKKISNSKRNYACHFSYCFNLLTNSYYTIIWENVLGAIQNGLTSIVSWPVSGRFDWFMCDLMLDRWKFCDFEVFRGFT